MLRESLNILHNFISEEDIIVLYDYLTGKETYRYTIPVEHPFYKGFYLIPSFSKYAISFTGDLISLVTGNIINWQCSNHTGTNVTGGYMVTNIFNDLGNRVGVSRHRLMMIVFSLYDFHPSTMWVNHIDGIPGNDTLYNLEWVTPGENVKHAYDNGLHPNKLLSIDIWNWMDNRMMSNISVNYAIGMLDMCEHTLRSRLNRNNGIKYADGWRVKLSEDSWFPLNDYVGQSLHHKPVLIRNIYTGEVTKVNTTIEASNLTGVNDSTISQHCRLQILMPFNGYNFRYANDFDVWPNYSEMHLELFSKVSDNNYSDGILVTNYDTGEIVFFGTQNEASEEFGLSKITLNKLARYEKVRNNLQYKLFRLKEGI